MIDFEMYDRLIEKQVRESGNQYVLSIYEIIKSILEENPGKEIKFNKPILDVDSQCEILAIFKHPEGYAGGYACRTKKGETINKFSPDTIFGHLDFSRVGTMSSVANALYCGEFLIEKH